MMIYFDLHVYQQSIRIYDKKSIIISTYVCFEWCTIGYVGTGLPYFKLIKE